MGEWLPQTILLTLFTYTGIKMALKGDNKETISYLIGLGTMLGLLLWGGFFG